MRAAIQLRALTGEIGCLSVCNIFAIPGAQNSLTDEGIPTETDGGKHMVSGATKMIDQLKWYTEALKKQRDSAGVPY